MTEFDLKVLDVWRSPNRNCFLKVDHEYSIPLGEVGHFGPADQFFLDKKYVKAGRTTQVEKVGRLVLSDDIQEMSSKLLEQIEYYQGKYHDAERFLQEYCNIPWWKRLIYGRKYIYDYLIKSLKENKNSNTLIEQIANHVDQV